MITVHLYGVQCNISTYIHSVNWSGQIASLLFCFFFNFVFRAYHRPPSSSLYSISYFIVNYETLKLATSTCVLVSVIQSFSKSFSPHPSQPVVVSVLRFGYFKKNIYYYLFEGAQRKRQITRQTEISCIVVRSQVPAIARTVPGWSQESGAQVWVSHVGGRNPILESLFAASWGVHYQEAGMANAGRWTQVFQYEMWVFQVVITEPNIHLRVHFRSWFWRVTVSGLEDPTYLASSDDLVGWILK